MNLYNLGLSGINAAQSRLTTTGHNISNADTEGYNRQRVMVSTAGASGTSNGFFGRGVQVDSVQRSYDSFLFRQLNSSQTAGASLVAHGKQLNMIDSILADRTVGVAPAINKFFNALDAVASAPADPAARQDLIGQAGSLVTQINELGAFLDDQANDVNIQITTTVSQINSYAERINDLNQQITSIKASNFNQPPNDLYDQRDQLVSELNQLVGVRVIEQGDTFNLSVGNGQVLLSGTTVYPLQAVQSAADPRDIVVAATVPTGADGGTTLVELKDNVIKGGSLGGLLDFRSQSLVPLQNDLGRMAVGLAQAVNALHNGGDDPANPTSRDLNGDPGTDFFSLAEIHALPNDRNTGDLDIALSFGDVNALTSSDYQIEYDGTDYTITRMPGNTQVYSGTGTPAPAFDGVTLALDGTPQAGDKWLLQPTRDAAANLGLAITDPEKIAAADGAGGTANGENALALAKLRNTKILANGTVSVNEAFSQLVNKGAVKSEQIGTAAKAQANLITQNYSAQQAVSGVNLNEEYMNLMRYQEQFRAAAQVIDAGTAIFDALLSLRQ